MSVCFLPPDCNCATPLWAFDAQGLLEKQLGRKGKLQLGMDSALRLSRELLAFSP